MHVVARNTAPGPGRGAFPFDGMGGMRDVPHGFVPVDELASLPAMGRWSALADGMPPWLPFHALLELARREQAGDDAARAWLELYRRAVQGDAAAQARMGRACERGEAGIAPDLARAFFWYYRAGLAGDAAASERALALKESSDIPAAAMEEPALVYPGQWRWRREHGEGGCERIVLELHEDGRVAGAGVNGLWSYDRARRTLTLAHRETWRVRILACRDCALYGRDAHGASCVLERLGPAGR
jgi:TPR repeat protein